MSTIKETAERICRNNLDSERVSVTQFCDIQAAIEKALRDRDERAAKIADERAAFNRRLARGRINDTVDSRVADLKLTRADEAEVIAKEIRED